MDTTKMTIEQMNTEFEKVKDRGSNHKGRAALINEGYKRGLIHQRGRGFVSISSAADHFVSTDPVCQKIQSLRKTQ